VSDTRPGTATRDRGRTRRGDAPPIDDRIAERRREVRRDRQLRRRRRTVRLLVAVVVVALLVIVERSPLVGLEDVQVAGTERLTATAVREAAALELGTSTLRLGLPTVEERVRALPLVGAVDAHRLDPLTVRIAVTEREPALVLRGDGEPVLADRTGVVIGPADGTLAAPDGLPVLALPGPPPAPGEGGPDGGPAAAAVTVWRGLSGPLRAEVERVRAASADDLTLDLGSGVEVRFGAAERIDEKVRALGAVLEDVRDTPVTAIDVRAPMRPVVVP
jgi:cell division protein FtsQ